MVRASAEVKPVIKIASAATMAKPNDLTMRKFAVANAVANSELSDIVIVPLKLARRVIHRFEPLPRLGFSRRVNF